MSWQIAPPFVLCIRRVLRSTDILDEDEEGQCQIGKDVCLQD